MVFNPNDPASLAEILAGTGIKPPAQLSPQDRINQASAALEQRDMSFLKGLPANSMAVDWGYVPPRAGAFPAGPPQQDTSMLRNLQGPAADWGYVQQPGNFPQAPQRPAAVPMPMPRPAAAPQPAPQQAAPMPQQADVSWFMRNAQMQRDPLSGEYLDPRLAALAQQQG